MVLPPHTETGEEAIIFMQFITFWNWISLFSCLILFCFGGEINEIQFNECKSFCLLIIKNKQSCFRLKFLLSIISGESNSFSDFMITFQCIDKLPIIALCYLIVSRQQHLFIFWTDTKLAIYCAMVNTMLVFNLHKIHIELASKCKILIWY